MMTRTNQPTMAEYFGWKAHPFSDTCQFPAPFIGERDQRIVDQALSLLQYGKSYAITGASGVGKSTLVQHLLSLLDTNYYRNIFIHYGGLQRNGVLRAVADKLGVEMRGRMPMLVTLQKQIASLITGANPVHPVIVVDDAQLLERQSLLDLCSLTVCPPTKKAAASLILVGDESLKKQMDLDVMTPIRTRMTVHFRMEPLDEKDAGEFISFRLRHAKTPPDLFERDAMPVVAAKCRGNRRRIMNTGTLLIEEAYYRQVKTINSELILACDLFNT